MTITITQLEKDVKRDFENGGPLVWEAAREMPKQSDLVYVGGRIFNFKTDRHSDIPFDQIMVVTAEERVRIINEIINKRPSVSSERLANILLYDKLYNPSMTKMQDEEYPIVSERQFQRREKAEIATGKRLYQNAADGQDHLIPTRRKRTEYENERVDKRTKSINDERKRKYNAFTKVQPVITWRINP